MPTEPSPSSTAVRLLGFSSVRPEFAVVLGSGFQAVAEEIDLEVEIPYDGLPGFPPARVGGHAGRLLAGQLGGVPVFVLCGRAHFYEGHEMSRVTFPVRVLAECGVRRLLLTNAAGGINRRFRPGDFVGLRDHINFMGVNPLRGRGDFLDLSQVYDLELGKLLARAARETKVRLHSGVYLAVSGPSYETPAEIRAFARLGADVVGMSTVPEAIVARQCGLRVAGLSCVTNLAAGRQRRALSHDEVLAIGEAVRDQARQMVTRFVQLQAGSTSRKS